MGDPRTFPEPSLAYRWIKANVYSALVNAVAGFITLGLGKALGVSDPDTGMLAMTIFVVLGSIVTVCSFAVFARLTGGVLAAKLPGFPMRTWIALHILLGFAFGVIMSLAATTPEGGDLDPLSSETVVGISLIATVLGAAFGAALGSLEALVLREAARGTGIWVAYSALAGTTLGLVILFAIYAPQSGLASDVAGEFAGFIMALMIGIILLPAVRQLQPREASIPAPGARLPP